MFAIILRGVTKCHQSLPVGIHSRNDIPVVKLLVSFELCKAFIKKLKLLIPFIQSFKIILTHVFYEKFRFSSDFRQGKK
jgi:hypothetical protein